MSNTAENTTEEASGIIPLIPGILVIVMVLGFFAFYKQDPHSLRYLIGKSIVVPYCNLGLLFYLLYAATIPFLKKHLVERQAYINEGVRDFEERDGAIAQKYRETKKRLATVEEEITKIIDKAESLASDESKEIIKKAHAQAERLQSETESAAAQELRKVQQSVQKEMIEAAFEKAEELLKQKLTPEEHTRLQNDYLEELGARS